ncbi:MAG TPA: helix-turn-helix domain-containing protein [Phycisphaerae bacterium]|nr:helix-turn-helix domain-containing protein [Phycisphaerae bacterium]HPS53440.1 helix-turn-helix domain-containing protein [Phycisphaerae bacterium]
MRKFHITSYISGNNVFHLHRANIEHYRYDAGHFHDYDEVFWVEAGEIWHNVNGIEEKLSPGDVCWVKASDRHSFRAAIPNSAIINLLFSRKVLQEIERKYFTGVTTAPWRMPLNHAVNHLTNKQLQLVNHQASQLAFAPQTRLSLDCFLLELIQMLVAGSHLLLPYDEYPIWLGRALRKFVEQGLWDVSFDNFAKMTGRTREHVSRTVKKITGQTVSELLNSIKLEKAATDLCMTTESILYVAMNAGFNNMSHFYKLFRLRFGQSPKKFRNTRIAIMQLKQPSVNKFIR